MNLNSLHQRNSYYILLIYCWYTGETNFDRISGSVHACKNNTLLQAAAANYCNFIQETAGPYSACHSFVNPTESFDACMSDFCNCKKEKHSDCACSAAKDYEKQCLAKGVIAFRSIVDACGVCGGDGTSCSQKYSTCTVFSSPLASVNGKKQKFTTFDCLLHKFQGSCEYVLARDCTDGLFDIHIENDCPFPNGIRTTWTKGIAIRTRQLGVVKALLSYKETKVYMNDSLLSWPSTNYGADGSRILLFTEVMEDKVEIVLASIDVRISVIDQHQIVVSIPRSFINKTCGLCGNYNGNPEDDLMLTNGKSLPVSNVDGSTSAMSVSNYLTFGTNWTAQGKDRLLLSPSDTCGKLIHVSYCDQLLDRRETVEKFCEVIIDPKGPFAEAHSYTDPETAYKQCVLSGCAHDGDKKYACSAILSYRDQCQRCNKNFLRPVVPDCGECIVNLHSVFALNMFNDFPLIIEISCSNLTTPADGSKKGSWNSFKDIITFSCNNGFTLSGSTFRQCQANGRWTGSPAVCTGKIS